MELDINKLLGDMLGAIKGIVGNHWKDVQETAEEFMRRRKERLLLLAELRISGDLTQEKFLSRLEDEKLILEAEMNALAVLTKAIAQKAANAAMDILKEAVKAAIGFAL